MKFQNILIIVLILIFMLTGCSSDRLQTVFGSYPEIEEDNSSSEGQPTVDEVIYPNATGEKTKVSGGKIVELDYSNTKDGYFIARTLTDNHKKIKIIVDVDTERGTTRYQYTLGEDFKDYTIPFSEGSANYKILVCELIEGTDYTIIDKLEVNVKLDNELSPYLIPHIFVEYDENTIAIEKSFDLTSKDMTELERVYSVYSWIIENVRYDWDKVEAARASFLISSVDETLSSKKGICGDYTALMAAMLRVQNIPTRMVYGYVEEGQKHAWVEVYIKDVGWISPKHHFEKETWTFIDPTFDSMNSDYSGPYDMTEYY